MASQSLRLVSFFLVLIVFQFSCKTMEGENFILPEFQVNFKSDSLVFHLDDETSVQFDNWRFNHELGVFSFFNPINRSVYIYEVGNESYRFKIPIEREGPNAIPRISQIHVHGVDSIFILSAFNNHTAFLIDTTGSVLDKYELSNRQQGEYFTSGSLQFGKQDFYFYEDKIFLTVMPRGENYKAKEKYPSLLIFDINTEKKEYFVDFPSRFYDFNFGVFQGMSHGLFHSSSKKFILSYPYHHELKSLDIITGEEFESKMGNPYVRLANYSNPDSEKEMRWYGFYFGWYDRMLFNPVDQTIWRMATVGRNFDKDQDLNESTIRNIHGGNEQFFTFIYDLDLKLKGFVKEFLHFQPIIFHEGKMYKKVPNTNPVTAENLVIFRHFELVEND